MGLLVRDSKVLIGFLFGSLWRGNMEWVSELEEGEVKYGRGLPGQVGEVEERVKLG